LSSALDDPLTLRAVQPDGANERVLYEPNPWIRDRALGAVHDLSFTHDGEQIQAWALLPPGRLSGDRVPTLLQIHGGPNKAYGWSFSHVFQVLASAGYAVIYCNPPGSQSYGQKFSHEITGVWGERDHPVFMACVDRAIDAGIADPNRLGVGGASYGGFATLWVISHTDRFKAAVASRPVSHLEGLYGSSDIGWIFGTGQLGLEPWEDEGLYRRLSPITYVDAIKTPLRLIACQADLRTPVEQAEQAYVRLRKMGRRVDLVLFPGEAHGIDVFGKPWNRVGHMRAMVDWFDHHLKPD
jgi:dipeptidyl aminopeptidase/acylaminoacyl peptidase